MSVKSTSTNQVIYGALGCGEDLMEGIIRICKENNLNSGMVTCIGSLDEVGFTVFKLNSENQLDGYAEPTIIKEPVELIQATGFVCIDENGEHDLHMHGMIERMDSTIQAGHFLRGYNKVCVTVELTIVASPEVTAYRRYNDSLGYKVIQFEDSI
ncbi:PPC domain-containing DNA-binding protein [Oceanobacillus jeddahense]|uniref:PPC domain-containing DNA-binding protein n=1 Tax=Oceanobacillus jeddahense TaxID=1462527 RepID=UPI0006949D9B|nr:PPC domain-containing DNA-binding protein [Oceanobacillus jeddahense]